MSGRDALGLPWCAVRLVVAGKQRLNTDPASVAVHERVVSANERAMHSAILHQNGSYVIGTTIAIVRRRVQ